MLLLSAQYHLSKARGSARQRQVITLARQERRIRAAFGTFLAQARAPKSLREINAALNATNLNAATDTVLQHVAVLGRALPQAFVDAAAAEADAIVAKVPGLAKAKAVTAQIAVGFDPSNARAASLMRNAQLQFVQQFTSAQRDAVRVAMARAYRTGAGTREAARAFRDSIGLTATQMDAVNSYRDLLEAGSKEALNRELRDRRYDRTVTRAARDSEPLDAQQIDRMVARYQANMLASRADTIARTEGLAVIGEARQEALRQIVEQAGFDPENVRRVWVTTHDGRERKSHYDMDGQTVGLDEPFVTPDGEELMYPGDPSASAAERINCRCSVTTDFL